MPVTPQPRRPRDHRFAPLVAAGGHLVLDDLVAPELLQQLAAECDRARSAARRQQRPEATVDGFRAGQPARRLLTAEGGPVQTAFYRNPRLSEALSRRCGLTLYPAGALGSYSYYEGSGAFLGLHRDIPGCDVALITCLGRDAGEDTGGALRLYPGAFREPLQSIDRGHTAHVDLQPRIGQSVLLLGGWIPHEVLPTTDGHLRRISLLCFSIAPAAR